MKKLSPIPIPLKQRWQDFKTLYLPILTFVSICGAVFLMWGRFITPSAVVGEVEPIRANIISTVPGTIISLNVTRLQHVTNGQCIAVLNMVDPTIASNELAVIEADLKVMRSRIKVSDSGNVNDMTEKRRQLLVERLDLNLAKVNLQQAESELNRAQQLFNEKLIPAGGSAGSSAYTYEMAVKNRDDYKAEVAHRQKLVDQTEADFNQLQSLGTNVTSEADEAIAKDIEVQKRHFESLNLNIELRSPMNGFVSALHCQNGEKVAAGVPLAVISAESSDHVIGWVRQPVTIQPMVGDVVQVRRPLFNGKSVSAKIIQVGSQYEPIAPTLSVIPLGTTSSRVELGLPFLVQLPKNARFTPGEPVHLTLPKRPRPDIAL